MNDQHLSKFEFFEKDNLLYFKWLADTHFASTEDMKKAFLDYKALLLEYQPIFIIIDEQDLGFTYSPNFQIWIGKTVEASIVEIGIKKIAIIKSSDFIIKLAIEQIIEDFGITQTMLFDNYEEAYNWIKGR